MGTNTEEKQGLVLEYVIEKLEELRHYKEYSCWEQKYGEYCAWQEVYTIMTGKRWQ